MTTGITGWRVTASDRAALLRKYRVLAGWRLARDDDKAKSGRAERGALKALAEEFPGALRELDLLGLPEIERRIETLAQLGPLRERARRRSAEGVARMTTGNQRQVEGDRWIAWILAYHALMRAALVTKRALGRAHPSAALLPMFLKRATTAAGVRVDESFVRAVAHPAGGRVAVVVLRAVALRFNETPAQISATLFPPRRPSPYELGPLAP